MKSKISLLGLFLILSAIIKIGLGPAQTTPDTTPPVITQIQITTPSSTTAEINWLTDEPSDANLYYGISPAHNIHAPYDETLRFAHSINLTDLSPETTYRFCIIPQDISGNKITDCSYTFTTPATPDTTPPVISEISAGMASVS